jgi:lipid-A-disaccharide synthase
MKPKSFMLIAGEASGDTLAAELVGSLRDRVLAAESQPTDDVQPLRTELPPHFFGAGGPGMKAAGVELAFDMTEHSVIGISEVFKKYLQFRRLFKQLLKLAIERQPDVIIGVDYGGFNLRFGKAIKQYVRKHRTEFVPWNPKLVQFVSPQVWASRPGRAYTLAENYDLLLSIFPFEKEWYARRVPKLRVEFVGHPMVERFQKSEVRSQKSRSHPPALVVLLPGSRPDEVRRHWPVATGAFELLRRELPTLRGRLVFPNDSLAQSARSFGTPPGLDIQVGGLDAALGEADVAIAKSGTITMECATFGVPTVVFYRASWLNYFIGSQLVNVPHIAMPNLLAGEEVFAEFVQDAATSKNIARAVLELLNDPTRREALKWNLKTIVASLGGPGATTRAAKAIVNLLK